MHKLLSNFSLAVSTIDLFSRLDVQAEEQSILDDDARLGLLSHMDTSTSETWNEKSLIDGNFKSLTKMKDEVIHNDGTKEM